MVPPRQAGALGTKRQESNNPHQEGRSPQSSSRADGNLLVCVGSTAASSCCSWALLWPCSAQDLSRFFTASRVCKVHFKTVSNFKVKFVQMATSVKPKVLRTGEALLPSFPFLEQAETAFELVFKNACNHTPTHKVPKCRISNIQ